MKTTSETNLNVVNFVPLFSGQFEIWQHVSSPLWSQQPVHFKVISQGKNRKRLHTHIQLTSYEDKWGGNYSVLNQCALETNWFDVDLVHRPLYTLKLYFTFFNWLHIQMRALCRNDGTHQDRDSPATSRTSSAGFSFYDKSLITVSWWPPGQGPHLSVARGPLTRSILSLHLQQYKSSCQTLVNVVCCCDRKVRV